MDYIDELLWYSIWPATIILSYYAILWVVKKYDWKFLSNSEDE